MFKLLILTTYLVSHIKAVNITLTCLKTDSNQCTSTFKFNISSNSKSTQYCIPEGRQCNISQVSTIDVYQCQTDFRNNLCPTRTCFKPLLQPICLNGLTSCPNTDTVDIYQYGYGNCSKIRGCNKCIHTYKNKTQILTQKCLGSLWHQRNYTSYQKYNIKLGINMTSNISKCSTTYDAYGLGCTCCTKNNQSVSICTNNYEILNNKDITNWFNLQNIYLITLIQIIYIFICMIVIY